MWRSVLDIGSWKERGREGERERGREGERERGEVFLP